MSIRLIKGDPQYKRSRNRKIKKVFILGLQIKNKTLF